MFHRERTSGVLLSCVAAVALAVVLAGLGSPGAEPNAVDPFVQQKKLGRGVNIIGYDPIWSSFERGRFKEKHFKALKDGGFQAVRINLHPFRHMDSSRTIRDSWLHTLDWAVEKALANGLMVILDMHEFNAIGNDPEGRKEAFLSFWKQVASRYKDASADVIFEILNEPCQRLTPDLWNKYFREALGIIRETNPARTVIVGPAFWNSIGHLQELDLPEDDRNIIVTVHYYSPMEFTHQGAAWTPQYKDKVGVEWRGTEAERQAVLKDFEKAQAWAQEHRRPLFLGEFGAYDKGDMASRARYTDCVARTAEKLGWSWAYWQFDSDFIVYDIGKDGWVEPIHRALVPPLPGPATSAEGSPLRETPGGRPNILLVIADDWGWPFAGPYGDPVVKTPNFERVAREGVLFTRAFVSSPSCTPSRSALLTGQHFWRLEESANLWSTFQPKFRTYPEILRDAGYFIGSSGKAWGPGDLKAAGREGNPAGPGFQGFPKFLEARPKGQPFAYWLGSSDPHRPYDPGSGVKSGMDLKKIKLPAWWPDCETVRSDLADYYFEVQRFDALVGSALKALEEAGELENTLVVVTGDNGAPFPRGKTRLYDAGVRVPLAVRWGARVKGGRTSDALVSLTDLAPTFLEAGGLKPPSDMTGRSLMDVLLPDKPAPPRELVLFGRERHTPAQGGNSLLACPMRAIRTQEFLYIWNLKPDLWPAGAPPAFSDCDDGPTKLHFLDRRDDPEVKRLFDLAFERRPADELYDLRKDPDQLRNVAAEAEYAGTLKKLSDRLKEELRAAADPRIVGGGEKFDEYPYFGRRADIPRGKRTEPQTSEGRKD